MSGWILESTDLFLNHPITVLELNLIDLSKLKLRDQ